MHNSNINKYLYKIFLIVVKYTPTVLALVYIATLVCNYFKIPAIGLTYFGGVSFMFIGLLYLISLVFQFCHLFKIPLYYVTTGNVLGILNKSLSYPVGALMMYRVYFIFTGIALLVYIWFMYKNRNKPKIDHIKKLCDSYSDCNC